MALYISCLALPMQVYTEDEVETAYTNGSGKSKSRRFAKINWLKASILASDKLLTVSPNYAAEIAANESQGVELDHVIRCLRMRCLSSCLSRTHRADSACFKSCNGSRDYGNERQILHYTLMQHFHRRQVSLRCSKGAQDSNTADHLHTTGTALHSMLRSDGLPSALQLHTSPSLPLIGSRSALPANTDGQLHL